MEEQEGEPKKKIKESARERQKERMRMVETGICGAKLK